MTDIQFKRGSTWPAYRLTLTRSGLPLPLAGAEVRLVAKSRLTGRS